MLLESLRKEVIETCLRLVSFSLVTLTGGNVSCRDSETGYIAITPSGMEYHLIKPEDIVIVDKNGRVVDGTKKPSIETPMHTLILRERRDINAVVHTHSLYATAFATTRKDLPVLTTELAIGMGTSITTGGYAIPGSRKLAEYMLESFGAEGRVALLANHGAIALGYDLKQAFSLAFSIEEAAKVYYIARNYGEPVEITEEMAEELSQVILIYGQ